MDTRLTFITFTIIITMLASYGLLLAAMLAL